MKYNCASHHPTIRLVPQTKPLLLKDSSVDDSDIDAFFLPLSNEIYLPVIFKMRVRRGTARVSRIHSAFTLHVK